LLLAHILEMAENPEEMVLPDETDVEDSQNPPESTLVSRRQKRLSKRAQRRATESSNSSVCPTFHFAALDRRLNTADGGRTPYAWFVLTICLWTGCQVLANVYIWGGTSADSSGLQLAIGGAFAVATGLSIFMLDHLRIVVRPTEHLVTLGAGRVKISERAATALKRARKFLRAPKLFFVGLGTVFVFGAIDTGLKFIKGPNLEEASGTLLLLSLGLWLALVFPLFFDWWLTLKVASALASDATLEVVNVAQMVSPTEEEWQQKVAEPAKGLALDTLDELTHGWGRALAVAYAVFWMSALTFFTFLLERNWGVGGTVMLFSVVVLCTFVPLLMSMDPASVSTSCDDLLTELNVQRSGLLGNEASIGQIMHLEDVSAALLRLLLLHFRYD
jgi:hypothetical protein